MKRRLLPLLIACSSSLLVHAPLPATGAAREPLLASPRIHPQVDAMFIHRASTGRTFPIFCRNPAFEETGRLPVVVRWLTPPDARKRASLVSRGVAFEKDEPTASGAWLATIDEAGLRELRADPELARVSVDLFHTSPLPLDESIQETRADIAKRVSIAKDGVRLDGRGVVIADIDTPVYIHHPAFFRADGGAFAWVDVNDDGELTPGTDGVDLDQSGTIEPTEILQELHSESVPAYKTKPFAEHDGFAPDLDYLFLDTNGNGLRDYGEGFEESTPAYGEPLYVFDDANHDGKTQPSERVLRLKTGKFKKVVDDKTYERGSSTKGLVHYAPESNEQLAAWISHATGVGGILAGGQPGISRWAGFAPDAELLLYSTMSRRGPTSGIDWAIDQHANIVLTEFAPYTDVSLDGSSETERMLDSAFDKGTIPVSPAGNLAQSFKHRTITFEPGTKSVVLATESELHFASISLYYKGAARKLSLTLVPPSGKGIEVPDAEMKTVKAEDGTVYGMNHTTPVGTHERFVNYVATNTLPAGAYMLQVTLDDGPPLEVDLFASDDVATWTGGFSFEENTEARTICHPATSGKTIAVAAYVLHDEDEYAPAGAKGERASYSSAGPTLSGDPGIDISAPDNPMSTSSPVKGISGPVWSPFGGTSGAGPHVAGALALVTQAFPKESAAARAKRIVDGARSFGGETVDTVGKGKLDVAAALDAMLPAGTPPKPTISVTNPPVAGGEATLRVEADDDDLTARWDLDYDGSFDTDWLPLGEAGEQTVSLAEIAVGASVGVKVEVRNAQGELNGATTTLVAVEPGEAEGASADGAADTGCACRAVGGGPKSQAPLLPIAALLALILLRRGATRRCCRGTR